MTRCPKCNSCNISGPRYQAGYTYEYKSECLVYTCCTCGFERRAPCKDADETKSESQQ